MGVQPTRLWDREETLGWKSESGYESVCVCVFTSKGTHAGNPDKFKCTVYQHSFMLLVLSQPSRDTPLLGISFMCATLSNESIMSFK